NSKNGRSTLPYPWTSADLSHDSGDLRMVRGFRAMGDFPTLFPANAGCQVPASVPTEFYLDALDQKLQSKTARVEETKQCANSSLDF
ncbi:MAG: hypothetical protein WBB50_10980, partial [Methyloceanibacter sp.]